MSGAWIRILLLASQIPSARAEFRLFVLAGATEQEAPPIYNLGAVAPGDVATARFRLRNQSSEPAMVSYLEVRGAGFGPNHPLALPLTLATGAAIDFNVEFSATDLATYSAALDSEGVSVLLVATVKADLPWPAPHLAIDAAHQQSGEQGSVTVQFDGPAARAGSGTVLVDFMPEPAGATDPAIVFASGGQTAVFTFARGDTQGQFANDVTARFQTGTTAGTVTLTAQVGGASDRTAIFIAPAPVRISRAQGFRTAATVEVRVTGFDNTRTAGPLAFTFFDGAGVPLAPGTLRTDSTAAFRQFFQISDSGGVFQLRAVFPVTGDVSRIARFEVAMGNSAGSALSSRTGF